MANIRKQFNFRNGVQVDDDNLVVSPTGLVGIGTTIPTEALDVRGTAKVVGLVTANQIYTPNLTATNLSITNLTLGDSIIGGGVSIRSGIITASGAGVVTYYGDGGRLLNLPTSQWLDVDAGLGFTSIYAQGFVGIGTNDPRFLFQISGTNSTTLVGFTSGVGFSSEGNILATGIATAYKFAGIGSNLTELNASNIAYGTIDNDRIPVLLNSKMPANISVSGIITATGGFIGTVAGNLFGNLTGNVTGDLTGNVTGIASTARTLTGNPDILVNNITATSIAVTSISASSIGCTGVNATGIITSSTFNIGLGGTIVSITSNGRIGIGSAIPEKEIQIVKNSIATVEVVGSEARLLLAQETSNVSFASSAAIIQYGNSDKTFELRNQAPGNFNSYLHSGGPGINTGRFGWLYGQNFSELMSLTYTGRLGLGITNPANTLHVVGTSTVTGNSFVGGNLTVYGTLNTTNIQLPSLIENSNINTTSGISTFNDVNLIGDLTVGSGSSIGIGTNSPVIGLDARNDSALFNSVGIGFTTYPTKQIAAPLHVVGNSVFEARVGVGTTSANYSVMYGSEANLEALVKVYDGYFEIENGAMSMYSSDIFLDPQSRLGVGTAIPLSGADFSNAGGSIIGGAARFMMLPRNTAAQRVGLITQTGSIIYNTTTNEFQGYGPVAGVSSSWINLGIQTSSINSNEINVSGIATANQIKVGTGVTINSGIVTAVNGFTSGIGTAIKITTVGNQIVFTVPGVGTTSLTLY